MKCTYVIIGLVRCVVNGGDYGSGRSRCTNNISQDSVPRLSWSGKASGCVGGRAGALRNCEGRFLNPLVRAGNGKVSGYIPR